MSQEPQKRPREEEKQKEESVSEPPKKRVSRVTTIGFGAAAKNTLSTPTLALLATKPKTLSEARPNLPESRTLLPPSIIAAETEHDGIPDSSRVPAAHRDEQLPIDAQEDADKGGHPPADSSSPASEPLSFERHKNADSAIVQSASGGRHSKGRMQATRGRGRGVAKQKAPERGNATQRARDRAHNEAILAAAGNSEGQAASCVDQVHTLLYID